MEGVTLWLINTFSSRSTSPGKQSSGRESSLYGSPYNAKVSLIHVDVNYSDLYTGLIDVNLGDMQKRISEETHHALTELSTNAGYPITETLSGSGDLGQVLVDAIKKYDMDLVVCGHHQDFWSKLMSSARQLINTVHVDMLIVPLRDEEE